ncbi:MAG: hypothetical protein HYY98_10460 [Burkholderiales bacterium]|nr:hypothetical protein [Burkholderiales bacterium]
MQPSTGLEAAKNIFAKHFKIDVQCKASLNRRLLLAVVLFGGDAEEIERPSVLTGNKKSCYNLRLC